MKRIKVIVSMSLVFAISLSILTPSTNAQAAKVKISKKSATIFVGNTTTLKVSGTKKTVKWSSSKKSVASVSSKGKVKALKSGNTAIIAKVGSKRYTCKVSVKNPHINKSNYALAIGKSLSLNVVGNKKAVSWSSSSPSVATVSSKGKVFALAVGTTNITAKIGSKQYTCKIAVNDGFEATQAVKNISADIKDIGKGAIAVLTNNNVYGLDINATLAFYNQAGNIVGTSTGKNYYFEPGKKCVMYFSGPKEPYSHCEISYSVVQLRTNIRSNVAGIKTEANFAGNKVIVKVSNIGSLSPDFTDISIIFYKDGKAVGCNHQYAAVESPGKTAFLEFRYPVDSNNNTIQIDSYEVNVDCSYDNY